MYISHTSVYISFTHPYNNPGESFHAELFPRPDTTDGPDGLHQFQRHSTGDLEDHHLDDGAEERRCSQGISNSTAKIIFLNACSSVDEG